MSPTEGSRIGGGVGVRGMELLELLQWGGGSKGASKAGSSSSLLSGESLSKGSLFPHGLQ